MVGIYKIENMVTGEVYIGQSKDIQKRWSAHKKNAFAKNKVRKYALYRDIRRYGIEKFTFDILELCNQYELDERENYWIAYYNKISHLYNIKVPEGVERR